MPCSFVSLRLVPICIPFVNLIRRICMSASGVALHDTAPVSAQPKGTSYAGALIVAPPSAAGSTWLRRFGDVSTAFASGWMQVRGARRRRSIDRGFVLSDHVDWPALLGAIEATGAESHRPSPSRSTPSRSPVPT